MKKPMPASLWWTVLIAVLLTITLSSCSRSKSTPEDIRVDAFNALRTEIVSIVAADDRQQQALNNVDEFERLFIRSTCFGQAHVVTSPQGTRWSQAGSPELRPNRRLESIGCRGRSG